MATRTCTYYSGTITGQAGSLITSLDAILVTGQGWTKLYSATNKAIYRMVGGTQNVLYVDDTGVLTAGAREATVRAAEGATGISALTDAWPSTSTVSDANCVWRKSASADATARNYYAIADSKFLALYIMMDGSNGDLYLFGDFEPYYSGDTFNCMLTTRGIGNNSGAAQAMAATAKTFADTSGTSLRMFFMRTAIGTTKAEVGAFVSSAASFGSISSAAIADYPNPNVGGMLMQSPAVITGTGSTVNNTPTDNAIIRGVVPFIFELLVGNGVTNLAHADTYTDTAYDASSDFVALASNASFTSTSVRIALQKAGTWRGMP